MRERTLSLNGEIKLESAAEGGTRVHLSFRQRTSVQPDSPAELELRSD